MEHETVNRLIVGITGATGVILGVRLLQLLQKTDIETHLIISKWGARTLVHETKFSVEAVQGLAKHNHQIGNQGAPVSSGSFLTRGMVIAPCSVRTLSAIANGQSDNLLHRAADVILKERRKLVLLVREAPLNDIHLENMLKLSRMGVVILPPVAAFYNQPKTLDDIIDHIAMRTLDQFGIHTDVVKRWDGAMKST